MGNHHSGSEHTVLDQSLLAQAEAQGWSKEEAENFGRAAATWIEPGQDTFEHQFGALRYSGVPGQVLHRLWLFQFALHDKYVKRSKRDRTKDLDVTYHVPKALINFDDHADADVLQAKLVELSGTVGGATSTEREAPVDPRVRYSVWDQFERQSDRHLTPAVLLTLFSWTRNLTASKRRKFVWDLFQVNGGMYPGRLVDLGSQTAKAFEVAFGEAEAKAIVGLTKHTPRHHVNFTEWVAWCKLHSLGHEDNNGAFSVLLDCFGLIPHMLKTVRRILQHNADASKRAFVGKVRLEQDVFSSECRVENGFLTLTSSRSRRVFDLKHSAALAQGRRHVLFKPSFGEPLVMKAKTMMARTMLVNAIRMYAASASDYSKNRFGSFHEQDDKPIVANWFVDGAGYYNSLLGMLNEAQSEILISDWSLSPEVYLLRGPEGGPHTRLDVVLKKKARQGVQVFILVWWEVAMAVAGAVNCRHVQEVFKDEKNITVFCHPVNNMVGKWSHHQKFVVVDRAVAYVGGLDLCFGRYDTQDHPLTDENHLAVTFPGKDFYNPNIRPCNNLELPFQENVDRSRECRMPWHDVHVQLTGAPVAYVARNFVERWNKTMTDMNVAAPTIAFDKAASALGAGVTGYPIKAQMLRSLAEWSGTNMTTECSIFNAYEHVIRNAQHFIYVENQFFVSSVDVVQNQVASLLVARIAHAVEHGEVFRVIVVVPLHPEGPYNSPTPRIVNLWLYRTVQNMLALFRKQCPGHRLEDFVSMYCPLQHAMLQEKPFLNMIYVHSKLIIADDRMAVVGSANINDRSMLGDRDSEIAVFLESCDEHTTSMAGVPGFKCSKMLQSWRTSIWREHLGFNYTTDEQMADPLDACKLFAVYGAINLALAEPVVRIDPQRVWATVSTGLPDSVSDAYVARSVREWLSDQKVAVGADLCRCCEHNRVGIDECAACQEPVCKNCALSREALAGSVGRKSRRNAVTTEALKASIALATSATPHPVLCHLCASVPCDVLGAGGSDVAAEEATAAAEVHLVNADFRIRSMLKRLSMSYDDESVVLLLKKCMQDRMLAASLLSNETQTRLRSLRGHVFPFPTTICPRLKPDIIAMAPTDIFI